MKQAEYFESFTKTWFDYNKKMMDTSLEMATEFWKPEQYEKFYQQWSQYMSDVMLKMTTNPEFTENAWKAFKANTGIFKFWQAVNQEYFKNMNLPTREEFDELTARMDYLEDQLAEMKKTMKEKKAKA